MRVVVLSFLDGIEQVALQGFCIWSVIRGRVERENPGAGQTGG